jgi:hypothetical protein
MTIKSIRTGWTGISALAGNPVIGDFESIQTHTVGSGGATDITFTSIPSSYQHLQIRVSGRTDRAASGDPLGIQFNGDTTNGNYYANHILEGNGSSAAASAGGTSTRLSLFRLAGATAGTSNFGSMIIDILDYTSTNKHKTVRSLGGNDTNGGGEIHFNSGLWFPSTIAGITSIKLFPVVGTNFAQYTHFALYGIR